MCVRSLLYVHDAFSLACLFYSKAYISLTALVCLTTVVIKADKSLSKGLRTAITAF